MDPDFGLIHVRPQTWFPMQVQVYVNGHEWLARKLAQHGVRYSKHDNAFLWIEDFARAQRFADRFVSLPWVARLFIALMSGEHAPRYAADPLHSGARESPATWSTTCNTCASEAAFTPTTGSD